MFEGAPMSAENNEQEEGIDTIPAIAGAGSFEELYEALDEIGELKGTQKMYTAENQKSKIEQVREVLKSDQRDEAGDTDVTVESISAILKHSGVTRTGGLQNKTAELLYRELFGF